MLIKEEALKLAYSFVVESNLAAFAVLCNRLQNLYEIPTLLGFQEEFQLTESLNTCVRSFMMNLEPAILVNFVKDRPLDDFIVPAIYGDLLRLSKTAMLRSESFFSTPLRDETRSILSTFTGMGLDLSMTLPQSDMYNFLSSGAGQNYQAVQGEGIAFGSSSRASRLPYIPTTSSPIGTISPLEYPLQQGTNISSLAGPLEVQTFFDLTPTYALTKDGYNASSSQIQSVEANHGDIEGLLVSSPNSLNQELTRLLDDTAEILNFCEEGPNIRHYLGSPETRANRQSSDLTFDTLLSEFQPSLPSSGSVTPQHKRSRPLRPAPIRQRATPRKRAAVKRRADKENTDTM